MSNLDTVITNLAAQIRTGMGSDIIAGRTFAYAPDSIDPPTCIVVPAPGDFLIYDDTYDGTAGYNLVVKILIGTQADRTGQEALLGYLDATGSTSIRAAIYTDVKLNNSCSFVRVQSAANYGDVEWGGLQYYGADLNVEVLT